MLASADRNAGKGDLNQEMAKGQAEVLLQSLEALDKNIQNEQDKVGKEQTKIDAFNHKVAILYKKIPAVKAVWKKLQLPTEKADKVFTKIMSNLKVLIDKAGLIEKGVVAAIESVPKVVQITANKMAAAQTTQKTQEEE